MTLPLAGIRYFAASLAFAHLLGVSTAVAQSSPSQADKIARLEKQRAMANDQLQRILQGKNPCYSDECQRKKFNLISRFDQRSELIPEVGKAFLKSRDSGVKSAYRLVREKFEAPKMKSYFPQTLSEWTQWWKKRYDHEREVRSDWMKLTSEVRVLFNSLEFYLQVSLMSPDQKDMIQEAIDRGMIEGIQYQVAMQTYAEQAGLLMNLAKDKAIEIGKKAREEQIKYDEVNSRFDGQLTPLLTKLFPQATDSFQVKAFLLSISDWMKYTGVRNLFDPLLKEDVEFRATQIRELYRLIQDFQDLEYGVVGIRNFYSNVNPAAAAQSEIPIQEFLDSFDFSARAAVEIGASYYIVVTGRVIFGVGLLSELFFPTTVNLIANENDFKVADQLWKKSNRTEVLKNSLETLEKEMEKRRLELFKAKAQREKIILQIDQELTRLRGEIKNDS